MAPSSSNPPTIQLDFSGAAIQGDSDEKDPIVFLPNQSYPISRLAIDIGGSLIKLVYFSSHNHQTTDAKEKGLGGNLHFVKFQTREINECIDFIYSNQLHRGGIDLHGQSSNTIIKATGGGAYKFADMLKERLGISIEKEDEMDCLVNGANILLKAITQEAFTHMNGQKEFVQIDQNDLFPYLLVNIGSGVSMMKVDGDGKHERVSGTSIGGGTYLGLARFLTKCKSFDELLELSQNGDNKAVDMLVGDIYGNRDYAKIGLSASAIASSFGKSISENRELEEYRPQDISRSLVLMIAYNIGQIAHLVSHLYGLKRILFGGFFIRSHAYTMDIISSAVHYWSKGETKALFLRHEGFLGALGAFMSPYLKEQPPLVELLVGEVHGPPTRNMSDKDQVMESMVSQHDEAILGLKYGSIQPNPLPKI